MNCSKAHNAFAFSVKMLTTSYLPSAIAFLWFPQHQPPKPHCSVRVVGILSHKGFASSLPLKLEGSPMLQVLPVTPPNLRMSPSNPPINILFPTVFITIRHSTWHVWHDYCINLQKKVLFYQWKESNCSLRHFQHLELFLLHQW